MLVHPVCQGLVNTQLAGCLHALLDGHLHVHSYAACQWIHPGRRIFPLLALWQSIDELFDGIQDLLLVICLREGATFHRTSLAYQVLVDPPSIATEIVGTPFAVYALVVARLTNNVYLGEQELMKVLCRSALSHSHGVTLGYMQVGM